MGVTSPAGSPPGSAPELMITDINPPKCCSKNNWYSGKYKLGFYDGLTDDNGLDWI